MAVIIICADPSCDEVVTHDRHRFYEQAIGEPEKFVAQYCDHHCPRCFHGRREA